MTLWSAIVRWRNWRLPIKLSAVVLVPVLFAITLGVIQVSGQVQQTNLYKHTADVVDTNQQLRELTASLQEERTQAAQFLAPSPGNISLLDQQRARADEALARAENAMHQLSGHLNAGANSGQGDTGRLVSSKHEAMHAQIARLDQLRPQVTASTIDSAAALTTYTEIVGSILNLERALSTEISDPGLNHLAGIAFDLSNAGEEIQLQHALVLNGLATGEFSPGTLQLLRQSQTRFEAKRADYLVGATPQQQRHFFDTVRGDQIANRDRIIRDALALNPEGNRTLPVAATEWTPASRAMSSAINRVIADTSTELSATATAKRETTSNTAGLASVVLLSTLLLATGITVLMGRHLLSSLKLLRDSARDAASRRLPESVATIREGKAVETSVDPVPVNTDEELGQLARAFDEVHGQALKLAAEQASMRKTYRDAFVNVSRRSQSLLQRQLRLFENLERDEEDAEQLATLFQLDHLATRMRRNNENLMVLSGASLAKRFSGPVGLADLLRAAISEVEHYPRVQMREPVDIQILDYAASDLVRMLAELIDNAANFSPPDTQVTVASNVRADGTIGIDILDHGVGMDESVLADANMRVSGSEEAMLSASRRMGLFVVGRLAKRHEVSVRLYGGGDLDGLRVCVVIPRSLTTSPSQSTSPATPQAPAARGSDDHSGTATTASTNGHVNGARVPSSVESHAYAARRDSDNLTVSIPTGSSSSPSDLFSPDAANVSQESSSSDSSEVGRSPADTTPIFDELASAWFQPSQPPPTAESTTSDSGAEHADQFASDRAQWAFSADEGFAKVRAASASQPSGYTTNGLPRRTPGARLVPGSAKSAETQMETAQSPEQATTSESAPDSGSASNSPPRLDANLLRNKLASFQEGVSQGREKGSSQST